MSQALPLRLHHHAWITDDQEVNRHFYEDVIGLPLVATWTEREVLSGAERAYSHALYGMADGSALAFFQFADPKDQEEFKTDLNFTPLRHIAFKVETETQEAILKRVTSAKLRRFERPRPRPRLLRLAVRHGPQRAHPGIRRRPPRRGEDRRRATRHSTRRPRPLARRRPHQQQPLALTPAAGQPCPVAVTATTPTCCDSAPNGGSGPSASRSSSRGLEEPGLRPALAAHRYKPIRLSDC